MAESGFSCTYPLTQQYYTLSYMNTQSFTDGTNHSLSKTLQVKCTTRPCYEISTSQFSDMKIRRLMRKYGFGGYSIYRYLVNEALHQGDYFLPWCEETARKTASYWNTSLEDVTRIVKGCIQVGLFNGGLYRKYRVLTSEDIQQNYLKTCCMLSQLPDISEELELAVS